MLVFDHLAVSAETLEEGVALVEQALGVALAGGGQHPHMATHNRLLGLGDLYLEVIAIDPDAPAPLWPRWFDLDNFTGPPRLTNWVARCDHLEAELARSPAGTGDPVSLARGDYRWQIAVPPDGRLPFDGAFPALIRWEGLLHPTGALPDTGLRLRRLTLSHPQAEALQHALSGRIEDARIHIETGAEKAMLAEFDTPGGPRRIEG